MQRCPSTTTKHPYFKWVSWAVTQFLFFFPQFCNESSWNNHRQSRTALSCLPQETQPGTSVLPSPPPKMIKKRKNKVKNKPNLASFLLPEKQHLALLCCCSPPPPRSLILTRYTKKSYQQDEAMASKKIQRFKCNFRSASAARHHFICQQNVLIIWQNKASSLPAFSTDIFGTG